MRRVLLDTDIVLDVLLQRQPFVLDAAQVWLAHERGQCECYVSAITPVNVFYIVRKLKGIAVARQAVHELLALFSVSLIDGMALVAAQALPISDYEDAVQHASAEASQLDAIITRNVTDYAGAALPVLSPGEFLQQLP